MPFELQLSELYGGYAAESIKAGQTGSLIVTEFLSTEDGQKLIERLEGIPNAILNAVSTKKHILPSQVDHLLAIIRRDRTVTVYVNELRTQFLARVSRAVSAGEGVTLDDVADISKVKFEGIDIPEDAGVIYTFSVGWRKGLFYDLAPLHAPEFQPRDFNFAEIAAKALMSVAFQERLKWTECDWDRMFETQWFPFIGLSIKVLKKLAAHLREGWNPDDLMPEIRDVIDSRIDDFLNAWNGHSAFAGHMPIIECACDRYRNHDYMSVTGLLYSRIEGVLRSNHIISGGISRPKSRDLVQSATSTSIKRERLLLLPEKFAEYLHTVFFAQFDDASVKNRVTRHSVSHGAAAAEMFNEKAAIIAILVLRQLLFCFECNNDAHD